MLDIHLSWVHTINNSNHHPMLKALKAWYLATFLPFEDPSHPLHSSQPDEFCKEISDWVDAELGPEYGPFEERRPRYKGSMICHTRRWYEEHDPSVDWDRLPKA